MSSTDDDDEEEDNPTEPALFRKLAAITNSSAVNRTSIVLDATSYVQELKRKVDKHLTDHHTMTTPPAANNSASSSHPQVLSDQVEVETLERGGYLIKVLLERKYSPGVLVSVLEAFENQLGLDVADARVSCSHNFQFEATATHHHRHHHHHHHGDSGINAQLVKQTVVQAITNWMETSTDDRKDEL